MKTIGINWWILGTIDQPHRDRGSSVSLGNAIPRGLALFLGAFALLNVFSGFHHHGFDANLWWIDLRTLPAWLANSLLCVSAFFLLAFGLRPPRSDWRRVVTLICAAGLAAATLLNAAAVYVLLARGAIGSRFPIPLSLLVSAALLCIIRALAHLPQRDEPRATSFVARLRESTPVALAFLACAVLFPLLQMFCFGKTDYRRSADVIVVPGARVYADGRLSDALADRVRTACDLYRRGFAHTLIFSGGPGDGAITEPEAMKRMAVDLGVRADDVLLDNAGLNTKATVRNSMGPLAQLHATRVLVVSHFYHLPRIKLSYQRAGMDVYTVPAKESYFLRQMPYNIAREVAALWVYYLRGA